MIKLRRNISSLKATRRLDEGCQALAKTFERLSSGMGINCASDDAVGHAIASSLKADSRELAQAIRNVNDEISLLNIAGFEHIIVQAKL